MSSRGPLSPDRLLVGALMLLVAALVIRAAIRVIASVLPSALALLAVAGLVVGAVAVWRSRSSGW